MKMRIRVEDRAYEVEVDFLDGAPRVNGNGHVAKTPVPQGVLRPRPPQRLPEDSVCRSPIAGCVIAVVADAGRSVVRNEPVVVLDAMKMEVPIGPATDGTVKAVHVAAGQSVKAGQVLFELA